MEATRDLLGNRKIKVLKPVFQKHDMIKSSHAVSFVQKHMMEILFIMMLVLMACTRTDTECFVF